ncbi:MAG: CRTAC1 family protein [Verrucomicrobia bacterium]|nr:CRTAC1 family protein [Verrucomicrobiota bacterium]
MKTKTTACLIGSVLLALSAYLLFRSANRADRTDPSERRTATGEFPVQSKSEPALTKDLRALEARRHRLEDTAWSKEAAAQRHEEIFIKLWDDLRNQEDASVVLASFPFGELRVGTLDKSEWREHQISLQQFKAPVQRLSHASWSRLVAELKHHGYRLEQSEWRHPRFALDTDGTAESTIYTTLHVFNSNTVERVIVRGNLRVEWRRQPDADGAPFPSLIDASQLEIVRRRGDAPFHHVIAVDFTPEKPEAKLAEPALHLYDLDSDGLSEIILPGRNRVFWNRGKGNFGPDKLLAYPLSSLSAGVFADFDNDGHVDLLAADSQGLALFAGDAQGRFPKPPRRIRFTARALANPHVMTAGDIDGDGDLDVWLAQYKAPYQGGQMPTPYYDANDGYPSFLLVNDGHGGFTDQAEQAGLDKKRFRRTYSSSLVDLDEDGDLDLLVVSDFAGTDVYFNDGRGHFEEVTSRVLDEAHAFGMAHTIGDFDRDGRLDFFVIGMNSFVADRLESLKAGLPDFPAHNRMRTQMAYGNRLYFRREGVFQQTPLSAQVARSGWSWGVASGDFDNDGDLDIYVVNGHISGRSAKDYETQFWTHDIYLGNSKENPALDQHFRAARARDQGAGLSYGGFEKNRLYLNQVGHSFLEAGYLMGVALEEDCRNAVSDDLDGDGKLDLLVTTFQTWPSFRQTLCLFPNFAEGAGNWIGIRLREFGRGFSPVGAKVLLTTAGGTQNRHFVTGDSYRSQPATTAHFGLGSESKVEAIEVIWPNGRRKTLRNPATNTYHAIRPGED